MSRLFGVGAVAEWTSGDIREGVLAGAVHWHAWRELTFLVALGVEFTPSDRSDEFLVRLGAEYGVPIGETGYEFAPGFDVDFSGEEVTLVVGAIVARSF